MQNDVYTYHTPKTLSCGIIVNSPHSGRSYPIEFIANSQLSLLHLRSSEDAFVDQLVGFAPEIGMPFLAAKKPRAFVDLNRHADELDPSMIEGLSSRHLNPRLASGLGVIPRVVGEGRVIQSGKISKLVAKARLARYYWPYHHKLEEILAAARANFPQVLLLDFHSMPSAAVAHLDTSVDVVIGDRFGAAARADISDMVEQAFAGQGFHVLRNTPFAGAYITRHYGLPRRGQNVIQVEINRALYLDEDRVEKHGGFDGLRARLMDALAELQHAFAHPIPVAAE